MTVKENVLKELENNRGAYVSGESLSEKLGVSRQSVWKAVKSLTGEGYEITSSTNRGYCLSGRCDLLSAALIEAASGAKTYCFDSVTSTNRVAKEIFFREGGCLVVSEQQTEGKKKDGGVFPSPRTAGIYMTVAREVCLPADGLEKFRICCAESVKRVLEGHTRTPAEIKNTDDIYMNGKKVCGILVECCLNIAAKTAESVFVGVGIYTDESRTIGSFGAVCSGDTRNKIIADIYREIVDI